jgi:hypothetical protein
MPLYTIVNKKTEDKETMMCSYVSLQEKLEELGEDWQQEIGAPALLYGSTGNVVNKTSDGWKDLLKSVKKGAGGDREGVTIKS